MKKEKPSKVRFVSTMPKSPGIFPEPEAAYRHIPSWYKNLESFYNNDSTPQNGHQNITAKRCVAFLDMLSTGYFLLAPFDIYIDTTDGKQTFEIPPGILTLQSTGMKQFIGSHDMRQVSGYPFDKNIFIDYLFRVHPIWIVQTDPGVSCMFIQPQHHEESPLYAVSAVIDTDGYPSDGLLSFLVKKDFKGYIKKGTPLVQVIPFKRQDYESEIVINQEEYGKTKLASLKIRTVFNSGYKKYFWKKKKYT